jgi:flagellar biosynthesis/type III secretory pathway protein FliH
MMDNWTACEVAYKNGYNKGYEVGQKDAMIEFLTEYGDALKEVVANLDRLLEKYKAE